MFSRLLKASHTIVHQRRTRLWCAALWLLFAQSTMAIHDDSPGSHTAGLDCQVCQAYERIAPPSPPIIDPLLKPAERAIRRQRFTAAWLVEADTVRPPPRAPPVPLSY